MQTNMGTIDRSVRILVAAGIVGLYFAGFIHGLLTIILGLFAVIFLVTSSIGWCPLYQAFGFTTVSKPPAGAPKA